MKNLNEIKQKIENALKNTNTMAAAARGLSINYKTFKKYAQEFGLFNPNQSGKGDYHLSLEKIFKNEAKVHSVYLKERLLKEDYFKYECSKCNLTEWNGEYIVLELDHINGNHDDNEFNNLRLLCPNCHSQTKNFRGRKNVNIKRITYEEIKIQFEKSNNISQLCSNLGILSGGGNLKILNKKLIFLNLKFNNECLMEIQQEKKYNTCKSCNTKIQNRSIFCVNCAHIKLRVSERPKYLELKTEIENIGYSATGRKYNVSDNAIRKWVKNYEKNEFIKIS
jgi:Zn finger protein HypA/HybF involved in hydrogenase expression